MNKILIVTNTLDPHADAVIRKIKSKDSVFRINTDQLLNSFEFEFVLHNNDASCSYLNPLGNRLNAAEISAVYYRRPEKPLTSVEGTLAKVAIDESWHGLFHMLYQSMDMKWLGHPHRDKYASSRVVQLSLANKLGWRTPDTIISRNPKHIKEFAVKHKDLAIKPLGEKGITDGSNWTPYFTSRITGEQILGSPDLQISTTYNYLQGYIEKKNEWRITVIGDKVFPCIIHSQDSEMGKTDWRTVDYATVRHEKGKIPDQFSKELVQYLKFLGIPFGAFDFILTPENEFVFLECNPNGQWLWIEDLTGMNISSAIARWLENNSK